MVVLFLKSYLPNLGILPVCAFVSQNYRPSRLVLYQRVGHVKGENRGSSCLSQKAKQAKSVLCGSEQSSAVDLLTIP